jgi:hypothetical protein
MLAPGVYSFLFSAEGYFPQTINNVTVSNFQTTVLNVELIPNPVPVELISFRAELSKNDVTLSWQTATENNNKGFEIERLQDYKINKLQDLPTGQAGWKTVGFEQGNGTTTEFNSYTFTDKNVEPGFYQYRLKQIDFDGSFTYSDIIEVEVEALLEFSLSQNYPNPFNPSTIISYQLPVNSWVTLKIYDILGNEIATLVNEEKPAGSYEVEFGSHSGSSGIRELTSGVYVYKLQAGDLIQTKKMVLMK